MRVTRAPYDAVLRLCLPRTVVCLLVVAVVLLGTTLTAQAFYFLGPYVYTAGTIPEDLTIADFNQDGLLDFAVGNSDVAGNGLVDQVSVFLGTGGGNFAPQSLFQVGGEPEAIVSGFFNNDSCLDLATANFRSSSVSILLGVPAQGGGCTGGFTPGPTIDMSISGVQLGPRGIAVGDFNGDGIEDLATANFWDNSVSILLGNGDGTFVVWDRIAVGPAPEMLVTANLNGDSYLDLVTVNNTTNSVTILHGQGDGTFLWAQDVTVGSFPRFVKAVDLNGDGFDDLLVANNQGASVSVLRNDGGTGYTPMAPLAASGLNGPIYINTGDLDGDGNLDVVVNYFFVNKFAIFRGFGAFAFGAPEIRSVPTGSGILGVGIEDFNEDGRLDLVVTNALSGKVNVYLSDPPILTSLGLWPSASTVAAGTTRTFEATGYDQHGVFLSTPVEWSVSGGGTIDENGVFTATTVGGPFTVTATSGAVSATAGVTVVDSSVQVYEATTGFSLVQGQGGWFYRDSTGAALTVDVANQLWKGTAAYLFLGPDWGHPGTSVDAIRRLVLPAAGTAQITGTARDLDPGGGNGVVVYIRHGTTTIWQATIANGNTTGVAFDVTVPVQAGYTLDFGINSRGNNSNDTHLLQPHGPVHCGRPGHDAAGAVQRDRLERDEHECDGVLGERRGEHQPGRVWADGELRSDHDAGPDARDDTYRPPEQLAARDGVPLSRGVGRCGGQPRDVGRCDVHDGANRRDDDLPGGDGLFARAGAGRLVLCGFHGGGAHRRRREPGVEGNRRVPLPRARLGAPGDERRSDPAPGAARGWHGADHGDGAGPGSGRRQRGGGVHPAWDHDDLAGHDRQREHDGGGVRPHGAGPGGGHAGLRHQQRREQQQRHHLLQPHGPVHCGRPGHDAAGAVQRDRLERDEHECDGVLGERRGEHQPGGVWADGELRPDHDAGPDARDGTYRPPEQLAAGDGVPLSRGVGRCGGQPRDIERCDVHDGANRRDDDLPGGDGLFARAGAGRLVLSGFHGGGAHRRRREPGVEGNRRVPLPRARLGAPGDDASMRSGAWCCPRLARRRSRGRRGTWIRAAATGWWCTSGMGPRRSGRPRSPTGTRRGWRSTSRCRSRRGTRWTSASTAEGTTATTPPTSTPRSCSLRVDPRTHFTNPPQD